MIACNEAFVVGGWGEYGAVGVTSSKFQVSSFWWPVAGWVYFYARLPPNMDGQFFDFGRKRNLDRVYTQ